LKLLFDTDVVLDLLLDRSPFAEPAAAVLSQVEAGQITGAVCATSVTTLHYLAAKVVGPKKAREQIAKILSFLEVAAVSRVTLEDALESPLPDFEDAVVCESARQIGCQGIVTRNIRHFSRSPVPAYTPSQMLALLESRDRTS